MNIALVDDQTPDREAGRVQLRSALTRLQLSGHIELYPSAEAFLAAWAPGQYALILLDIYMEGMDGVELARRIRRRDGDAALVFCTTGNEYAAESYEVAAAGYLRKPVTAAALTDLLRRLEAVRAQRSRALTLPDGYRVLIRKLMYTDYVNHTIRFNIQGEPPHPVYMTHAQAEELLLPEKHFVTVNKGCIVNLSAVKRLAGTSLVMGNGEAIPIARRRFKDVQAAYTRYHFDTLDEEVTP